MSGASFFQIKYTYRRFGVTKTPVGKREKKGGKCAPNLTTFQLIKRFTQNAYMYMRIDVFDQNAGMRAPEWAVFFVVEGAQICIRN